MQCVFWIFHLSEYVLCDRLRETHDLFLQCGMHTSLAEGLEITLRWYEHSG